MVDHIVALVTDNAKRLDFGQMARKIAQERFSWEHHMEEMYRAWHDARRAFPRSTTVG